MDRHPKASYYHQILDISSLFESTHMNHGFCVVAVSNFAHLAGSDPPHAMNADREVLAADFNLHFASRHGADALMRHGGVRGIYHARWNTADLKMDSRELDAIFSRIHVDG